MRKITFLIASLFLTIGAMAQNATTHENGVYKIFWQWNGRGYLTYHADYPNDPQLAGVTLSGCQSKHYALTDEGIQLSWYLYTSPKTGKTYLFEATTGKFITINTSVAVGNGKKCVLSAEVTEQAQLDLKATTNTQGYMLSFGSYNFCSGCGSEKGQNPVRFATDGQTDGGIPFVFVSEGASITDEVKDAAIAKIQAFEASGWEYTLTDMAGNEFTGYFYGEANVAKPTLTGAYGYTLTDEVWENGNYTATINFAYPVSRIGGATNETLLTINGLNKFIRAVGDDVKVQSADVDANCLWAIYPTFNNGAFTFTIMNVATGKYVKTTKTSATHNAQGTVVLSNKTEATSFVIGANNEFKVGGLFLSINSPSRDTDVYLGVYGSEHDGTNIIEKSLTKYEATITDAKYATFYAPVAVTVPAGVTAHTVTINGEWATLSEALTVIPAYTGVVLYSENAGTYALTVTNEQVAPIKNNALKGTVAATYVGDDAYVLTNGKDGACFGIADKNQLEGMAWLNNHHKAYLYISTSQNVAAYSFRFGGNTTAVEEVETENAEAVIYDLSGRRINEITEAGIYIVNGKKVLVK